jgi:hypothetical protein
MIATLANGVTDMARGTLRDAATSFERVIAGDRSDERSEASRL